MSENNQQTTPTQSSQSATSSGGGAATSTNADPSQSVNLVKMCLTGCGFYGSTLLAGLCSHCHGRINVRNHREAELPSLNTSNNLKSDEKLDDCSQATLASPSCLESIDIRLAASLSKKIAENERNRRPQIVSSGESIKVVNSPVADAGELLTTYNGCSKAKNFCLDGSTSTESILSCAPCMQTGSTVTIGNSSCISGLSIVSSPKSPISAVVTSNLPSSGQCIGQERVSSDYIHLPHNCASMRPSCSLVFSTSPSDSHSTTLSQSVSLSTSPLCLVEDNFKRKRRCSTCRKNIGLLGFNCRCGGIFCSQHRYSDTHDCHFDYREAGRDDIRKSNPPVRGDKICKI